MRLLGFPLVKGDGRGIDALASCLLSFPFAASNDSRLTIPDSRFPIPDSRFPTPDRNVKNLPL
ncbi:hypothetical protein BJP36_42770 [Moorena producens JHB]|uniref:Uncharacterized protein n=1 Tax=Moorena producens (strain JHB) TaxID=1454205 RepID=A0A9Q9SSZ8_MOOP1|nr:hypothetical protein [Moorena producens]WAN69083.1 hypothetical protein BJP36_42770 [Moorena producens JHB]